MLNSTDDAISVRYASSRAAGGVSIWPGGVIVSPGADGWTTQGGVSICPGFGGEQADVLLTAVKLSREAKTTAVPSVLRFFMVFSWLGLVTAL